MEEILMYVEFVRGLCFDWWLGLIMMLKVYIFSMINVYVILLMFNKFFNNLKKKDLFIMLVFINLCFLVV